ncbi:MAG: class I SAM-dependent methyltransferase [Nanoarchaeota archaeon]|nr:class I SAM-dependent methyltransferase [Nanoarchaeota archaeon]
MVTEKEVLKAKDYFEKEWKIHVDEAFDKTYSLRNWTVILGVINSYRYKNILQIGSGPGYFLSVLNDLGKRCAGIEPFVRAVDSSLTVYRCQVQEVLKPEFFAELKKQRFDAVVSHDVFTESIMFDKKVSLDVLHQLKRLHSAILLGFTNEQPIFEENDLKCEYQYLDDGYGKEQLLITL